MGASLVMTDESLTAASFWDLFRMMECQSFAGVPYSYEILRRLDVNKLAGSTLSVMTQAGGKLQRELIAYFHKVMAARDGLFFVMYGQTEATARISVLPPSFLPEKLGSVGIPIPEGSLGLKLDDSITREAKQRGELVYSGPNVMMGYAIGPDDIGLGDILAGTLYTGDLAHFDDDGFTYINGRMKRDAKIFWPAREPRRDRRHFARLRTHGCRCRQREASRVLRVWRRVRIRPNTSGTGRQADGALQRVSLSPARPDPNQFKRKN